MLDLFLSELFIEIPLAQGTPVSLLRSFYRNPFSSGIPRRHSHIGIFHRNPSRSGSAANLSLLRSFHRNPFGSGIPRSTFSHRNFSSKSLSLRERPPTSPCCALFTAIPSAQEIRARPSLIGTFHRNPFRSGSARQRLLVAFFLPPSLRPRNTALDLLLSVLFIEIPLAQEAPPTSPCCVLFTAIPSAQESRARLSLIGTFHRNPSRSGNAR